MDLFYRPTIFQDFPDLIVAESTRHGGVSKPPYESLNLGLNTDDEEEAVAQNRTIFFDALGVGKNQIVSTYQCHGSRILKANTPGHFQDYDAIISDQPNLYLTIGIADCTPILIYHPPTLAFAAIHAGWRGTVAQIAKQTLEALAIHYGVQANECLAYIGTCIDLNHFEVGIEVADQFDERFKVWDESRQKYLVDLKAANSDQLLQGGLSKECIEISPYSTFENNDRFFSYRKEYGKTGRMLVLIGYQRNVD